MTKAQKEKRNRKLAEEIREFLFKWGMWIDTTIYFNGKAFSPIEKDENGKMNLGLAEVNGEVLVVSQFTLYGNCRKGRRPSFVEAAPPELGEAMYERFLEICREMGYEPQHGQFGADMQVESVNDGPVTLILDTDQLMDTPRR